MVYGLVAAALIAAAIVTVALVRAVRRRRRRRAAATMFVTTYPSIELEQPYGAWDADAYDARVDDPRVLMPVRLDPGVSWRWGRLR